MNVSSLALPPIDSTSVCHKIRHPIPKKGSVTKLATPTRKKARSRNSRPQPEKMLGHKIENTPRLQKLCGAVSSVGALQTMQTNLCIQSRNIMPRSKPPKYCPTCTEIFSQPTCSRHCKGPQMCRMHGYKKLVISKARPNLAAVGSRAFLSRAFICRRLVISKARRPSK